MNDFPSFDEWEVPLIDHPLWAEAWDTCIEGGVLPPEELPLITDDQPFPAWRPSGEA